VDSISVVVCFIDVFNVLYFGLGGTTGSESDSRSEGRGFDSH